MARVGERKLTPSQSKALEILRDEGPLRGREFARAMWPDSPGWTRVAKCGPGGSHQGGGMYGAGGAYMGKLRHLGLAEYISYTEGYCITMAGRDALVSGAYEVKGGDSE